MRTLVCIPALCAVAACTDYQLTLAEPAIEEWVVEGDVDILVFADTSESMEDQLDTMAQSMQIVASRLEEAHVDWQLLAVTGPDGCGQGGVITSDVPDWPSVFEAGINTKPGEDFVDEWGLYNGAQAIAESAQGGCNEGFLRPSAYLHAVFISDEDDNSPGWDEEPDYWRGYVDQFLAAKENPGTVHLSAVAGPDPVGCSEAEYGRGYWEATEATGGQFLSICGDWAYEAVALADTSVTRESFPLESVPRDDTLQVFVDGAERLTGWHHEPGPNRVVFQFDPPYAGQHVTIAYDVDATGGRPAR